MHSRRATAALGLLAILSVTRGARASAAAKLTYVRSAGAEKCPDEAGLRAAVSARVGYDLFFPWAQKTVVVEIMPAATHGYRGTVQILNDHGVAVGERQLASASDDCADLMRALALTISIAVDDRTLDYVAPAPPPPPPTQLSPAPTAAAPPLVTTPPREEHVAAPQPPAARSELSAEAWLTPTVAFDVAPGAAIGAEANASLRYSTFSLGLGLRGDLPASGGGQVSTSLLLVTVTPCVHEPRPLVVCAVAGAGSFTAAGSGISSPLTSHAPFATAGGRVAVEVPVAGGAFFVGHADALAALTRHRVDVDATPAFTVPFASVVLGAGLGLHF